MSALPLWAGRASTVVAACVVLSFLGKLGPVLFAFHPILMSVGVLAFAANGVLAYKSEVGSKEQQRGTHRNLQVWAVCAMALGAVVIVANKVKVKHSLVPSSPHSILGAITLLLMVLQAAIGLSKLATLRSSGESTLKFHGKMGMLVYVMAAVAATLGLLETKKALSANLAAFLAVLVALVSFTVVVVHGQQSTEHEYKPVGGVETVVKAGRQYDGQTSM